jgi:hypothetical protein
VQLRINPQPTHDKLTRPRTADIDNLTQSIGVKPGFFFSGCNGNGYKVHKVLFSYNRSLTVIKSN